MIKDQCISVTDLRTKTKQCIDESKKEPKYIFINNKPVAVLINMTEYENNFIKPRLIELKEYEADESLKNEAKNARKTRKKDLMDI